MSLNIYDAANSQLNKVSMSGGGKPPVKAFAKATYFANTSAVTAIKGNITLTSDLSGDYVFELPETGGWTFNYDGDILIKTADYGDSLNCNFLTKALRTNFSQSKILLSNWIVNYSDNFEFMFKINSNPSTRGLWPKLLWNNKDNLIQFNLYSGRHVINVRWNNKYTGDSAIAYETPYDYINYYIVEKQQNYFKIYRLTMIDGERTLMVAQELSDCSPDTVSPDTIFLFNDSAEDVMDMNFYYLKVYSKDNDILHHYLPYSLNSVVGLKDMVTDDFFTSENANTFTIEQ